MEDMLRAKLLVEGNIQSMGYRALVKVIARRLGVNGVVRNLENDRVEIEAEAPDAATLGRFESAIARKAGEGDYLSPHVTRIETISEERVPEGRYKTFEVDYGGEMTTFERESLECLEMRIVVLSSFKDESRSSFKPLEEEISGFRGDTHSSFETMDKKYDSISKTLTEFKTELIAALTEVAKAFAKKETPG